MRTSTFNLPNFRGRFLRGYLAGTSAAFGALQQSASPNITGSFGATIYGAADMNDTGAFSKTLTNSYVLSAVDRPLLTYRHAFNASRSSAIYGRSTDLFPANYAVQFFIKY